MQDKNSKPGNECSNAKFETFLSKADAPAITVFLLRKDKFWKKQLQIITKRHVL